MKRLKNWDIVAVVAAGFFACCTLGLGGLYFNEHQNLQSYKEAYSSITTQYNDLITEYNNVCEELEKAGASITTSSRKLLENGHFVAGEDFPAGTYDIEAVSGCGNVYSDNLLDGGINAVMGVASEDIFGTAERKYSNVYLPEGTTLSVLDVKVRITRVDD